MSFVSRKGRLKDFAFINESNLPASTDANYSIRYVEISNVDLNGLIAEENIEALRFKNAPSRARRRITPRSTIISSVRPNLQAMAYFELTDVNLICSTGFNVVEPRFNYVLGKFLYYLLKSNDSLQYFMATAKGVGYPAVDEKDFKSLVASLPEIAEQIRIATFLDQTCAAIDRAIAIKQQQLEKLDQLRKSIIYKAVTKGLDDSVEMRDSASSWIGKIPRHWKVKKLKRLLSEPLKYGANEAADLDDPELPRYIRITDFDESGALKGNTFKSLPLDVAQGYLLKEGDILFARSGATVGKTFQFSNYNGLACFAGYLIRARVNQRLLLSDFLYLFTKSKAYLDWKDSAFTQATIQNIGADKYAYLPVVQPPLDEQAQIVNFILKESSRIYSLSEMLVEQINVLMDYKKSLIHECVTGKRRISEADLRQVA